MYIIYINHILRNNGNIPTREEYYNHCYNKVQVCMYIVYKLSLFFMPLKCCHLEANFQSFGSLIFNVGYIWHQKWIENYSSSIVTKYAYCMCNLYYSNINSRSYLNTSLPSLVSKYWKFDILNNNDVHVSGFYDSYILMVYLFIQYFPLVHGIICRPRLKNPNFQNVGS